MRWRPQGLFGRALLFPVLIVWLLAATQPVRAENGHADSITLATYPFGDAAIIHKAFSPLAQYLEEALSVPVQLVVTRDYGELAGRLREGTVDLAWIGSANYVHIFESAPAPQYIATYRERSMESGQLQAFYRAAILALSNSEYASLDDLEGVRFGFTDPDSTSGHAYPRMMLAQAQIEPESFFANIYYLGTHRSVIEALLAGSIHAGAVSDGTYYNAMTDYPAQFRVIAWSDPIPLDAFVAAAEVPEATVDQVRQALLDIGAGDHPVNQAIRDQLGWPAAGFEKRSAEFYRPLAQALAGSSVEP